MGGCITSQTKRWWIMLLVIGLAGAAGLGVPIALKIHSGASYEERLEFASRLLQEVPLIDGYEFFVNKYRTFFIALNVPVPFRSLLLSNVKHGCYLYG